MASNKLVLHQFFQGTAASRSGALPSGKPPKQQSQPACAWWEYVPTQEITRGRDYALASLNLVSEALKRNG